MSLQQYATAAAVGVASYYLAKYLDKKKTTGKIVVGYWGIRGLGAPLRMMCAYSGADHEVVSYSAPEPWFGKKKPELLKKNPLANLPYLEMPDGTVVCESNACFAHLADHLGLVPTSAAAKIRDAELLNLCMCTRNDMTNRCYDKAKCPDRAAFDASMATLFEGSIFGKYEATLVASGTPFFCGDSPCACDFHIFEMMDQFTKLGADLKLSPPLAKLPLCAAFHERFKALPSLAAYFASDIYKAPVNAPNMANWS